MTQTKMNQKTHTNSKSTVIFTSEFSGSSLSLSKNTSVKLPTGKISVQGMIGVFAFQAVVENGAIKITRAMNDMLDLTEGDEVKVEIVRINDEPEVRVPADLRKAFDVNKKAKETWEDITPLARRDWIFWMISAKKQETREKHIVKMIDMLSHGKRRVCCFAGVHFVGEK